VQQLRQLGVEVTVMAGVPDGGPLAGGVPSATA